jgi:hypothetical protein
MKEEKSCGMLRPSNTELCGHACACLHENIDLRSHVLSIRGGGSLQAARDEYAGGRGLHMGQEWVGAGQAIREVLLRQRDGERPFSPPIFTWSSGEEEVEGAPKPALCAREAYSKAFQLDSDCIVNEDSDIIVTPPFAPLSLANLTSSLTPSPENQAFLRELERLHVASLQHPPLSAHTRFNTLSKPPHPHTPTHAPPHPLARPEALFDSSSADGSGNTASSYGHDDAGDGGITDREQSEHQVRTKALALLLQQKSTNTKAKVQVQQRRLKEHTRNKEMTACFLTPTAAFLEGKQPPQPQERFFASGAGGTEALMDAAAASLHRRQLQITQHPQRARLDLLPLNAAGVDRGEEESAAAAPLRRRQLQITQPPQRARLDLLPLTAATEKIGDEERALRRRQDAARSSKLLEALEAAPVPHDLEELQRADSLARADMLLGNMTYAAEAALSVRALAPFALAVRAGDEYTSSLRPSSLIH